MRLISNRPIIKLNWITSYVIYKTFFRVSWAQADNWVVWLLTFYHLLIRSHVPESEPIKNITYHQVLTGSQVSGSTMKLNVISWPFNTWCIAFGVCMWSHDGRREVAMASCERCMCARIASCHGKLRSLYVWNNGRLLSQLALAVCAGS